MKTYRCNVCGRIYTMPEKKLAHNLKHYGKELPMFECWEDDGGKLVEIENESNN